MPKLLLAEREMVFHWWADGSVILQGAPHLLSSLWIRACSGQNLKYNIGNT